MKYRIGILKSENANDHLPWVDACEKHRNSIDYSVIDLLCGNWINDILQFDADCYLTRPSGTLASYKTFYDERLSLIVNQMGKKIYPNLTSNLIYENKRSLANWLQVMEVSHPKTIVSMGYEDAIKCSKSLGYPIVAKTSIGAGGSGVRFLYNNAELESYCRSVFWGTGATRTWGPNLRKGSILERSIARLSHPVSTLKYFQEKKRHSTSEPQKNHVILQEYIESDYEWRITRVGNSFFGHKKLKGNSKMFSGTSLVSWDYPNNEILDFAKKITDLGGFTSMAVDLFVGKEGKMYVNELQCFWGSKNPHQMIVDGKPGRFIYKHGEWQFEAGTFNTNNSYNLRLEFVLQMLNNSI